MSSCIRTNIILHFCNVVFFLARPYVSQSNPQLRFKARKIVCQTPVNNWQYKKGKWVVLNGGNCLVWKIVAGKSTFESECKVGGGWDDKVLKSWQLEWSGVKDEKGSATTSQKSRQNRRGEQFFAEERGLKLVIAKPNLWLGACT